MQPELDEAFAKLRSAIAQNEKRYTEALEQKVGKLLMQLDASTQVIEQQAMAIDTRDKTCEAAETAEDFRAVQAERDEARAQLGALRERVGRLEDLVRRTLNFVQSANNVLAGTERELRAERTRINGLADRKACEDPAGPTDRTPKNSGR